MESVFQLMNIRYGDILNIKRMDIPKDKITCIVGESGSGKTTLLKMLNCLISPTEGEILFQEKNISEMDPVELRRKVVMLAQNPVMFPATVRDNLNIALRFSEREPMEDQEMKKYLEMVHLDKSLDQPVENMSGGEKQRLALARVFILNPEVFLLDEPSSALDEETEILIIKETVRYVKQYGKTLIMVTHSKSMAETYGENIIKISKGQFVKEGEM